MTEKCSVCGGVIFQFLGQLGLLRWYRCRSCGADHYIPVEEFGKDV
jgi:hypothetical protein